MFAREERTFWDNIKLGGVFVFLGGYVGVLTAVIFGHFLNCMTGNVTEAGLSIGHFEFHEALVFFVVVICYIFGSFLSTKILDNYELGHINILFAESFLLGIVGFVPVTPALFLAALTMGLQNGLTTYITWTSGKVRSTHVTGTTTDIGVSFANGNKKETGFTIFQALTYLVGALSGFAVVQNVGNLAFAIGGAAVFLIAIIDIGERSLSKTPAV